MLVPVRKRECSVEDHDTLFFAKRTCLFRRPGKRRALETRVDLCRAAEDVPSAGRARSPVGTRKSGVLLVGAGRLTARGNGIRGSEVAAGVGKRRVADDVIDARRTSCLVRRRHFVWATERLEREKGKKVGALRNSGRADGGNRHCGLAPAVGGDAVPIRRWRTCACVPRGRCLRQEFPRPRACGTPRRS